MTEQLSRNSMAKTVACPKCGAKPGQICRGGQRKYTVPVRSHYERLRAYAEKLASEESHGLRDLAGKLYEMARDHPCWPQAHGVVLNCIDHLTAKAAYHELNEKLHGQNKAAVDGEGRGNKAGKV